MVIHDTDKTPVQSDAEISMITEVSNALRSHQEAIERLIAQQNNQFDERLRKAEETSGSLPLPKSVKKWKLITAIAALLGIGGTGGAWANTIDVVERYDESIRQQVISEQARAQFEADTKEHLEHPHIDIGDLTQKIGQLEDRLASMDAKLERLERLADAKKPRPVVR